MKIALNGATTMHADLLTDIKAASAAGFDLLEIWSAKLYEYLKTNTPADLKAALGGAQTRAVLDKFDRTRNVSNTRRITPGSRQNAKHFRRSPARSDARILSSCRA